MRAYAALLATLLSVTTNAVAKNAGYPVYKTLRKHTYDVGPGTGFSVSYKGKTYLVTNWHVCDNFSGSQTIRNDERNEFRTSTVTASFPSKDLCVMTSVSDSGLAIGEDVKPGYPVYTAGYPSTYKGKLHLSKGRAGRKHEVTMEMTTPENCEPGLNLRVERNPKTNKIKSVCEGTFEVQDSTLYGWYGSSGSPVVNSKGELVGIINHAIGTEGPPLSGKAGFIPASALRAILDSFQSEGP